MNMSADSNNNKINIKLNDMIDININPNKISDYISEFTKRKIKDLFSDEKEDKSLTECQNTSKLKQKVRNSKRISMSNNMKSKNKNDKS